VRIVHLRLTTIIIEENEGIIPVDGTLKESKVLEIKRLQHWAISLFVRQKSGEGRRLERSSSRRVRVGRPRHRALLLNLVTKDIQAKSYLEIGVHRGLTFERVSVAQKTGVEPLSLFAADRMPRDCEIFVGTSDEYFGQAGQARFDLIFIDGLHHLRQVVTDLTNGLLHLNPGGVIAIDDTWPRDELGTIPDHDSSLEARKQAGDTSIKWWGDVWKLLLWLAEKGELVDWCTVTHNFDGDEVHGVTLLWPVGEGSLPKESSLDRVADARFADYFARANVVPNFLKSIRMADLKMTLDSRLI
jgi:predicted O-methyltransferase YrrM